MYPCFKCSKNFKYKKNAVRHEKKCGTESSTTTISSSDNTCNNTKNEKKTSVVTCPDCYQIFGKLDNLRDHVHASHDVHQEVETLKFETRKDFEDWKVRIEKENQCYYPKKRSFSIDKNGIARSYFYCHRTGFFNSESKGIRRIKSQGTNKINSTCTSSMVVLENKSTGNIEVVHHKTHFGHGSNLGRSYTTNEECSVFADNVVESEQIIQFEQTLVNVNHHPKKDDRINQILLKVNALKGILMNKNNEFSSEELRAVENEIDSIINLASKGKRKIKDVIQNGEPSNEGLEKEMQFSKKQKESKNITLHASQ